MPLTYDNPPVLSSPPANGQAPVWNDTLGIWTPVTPGTDFTTLAAFVQAFLASATTTAALAAIAAEPAYRALNTQTTDYTFVLADAVKRCRMNSATAKTFTIPPSSAVAWVTGTRIPCRRLGVGDVIIAPGVGVTLNLPGGRNKIAEQYAVAELLYDGADVWFCDGDMTV